MRRQRPGWSGGWRRRGWVRGKRGHLAFSFRVHWPRGGCSPARVLCAIRPGKRCPNRSTFRHSDNVVHVFKGDGDECQRETRRRGGWANRPRARRVGHVKGNPHCFGAIIKQRHAICRINRRHVCQWVAQRCEVAQAGFISFVILIGSGCRRCGTHPKTPPQHNETYRHVSVCFHVQCPIPCTKK